MQFGDSVRWIFFGSLLFLGRLSGYFIFTFGCHLGPRELGFSPSGGLRFQTWGSVGIELLLVAGVRDFRSSCVACGVVSGRGRRFV